MHSCFFPGVRTMHFKVLRSSFAIKDYYYSFLRNTINAVHVAKASFLGSALSKNEQNH